MVGIWWISSKWVPSKTSLKKGRTAMPDDPEENAPSFAPLACGDSTRKNWPITIAVLFTVTLIIKGFDSYTDWRVIDKAKDNLIKYEGLSEDYIRNDLNGYCKFSFIPLYRETLNVTTLLSDYRRLPAIATYIWCTALAVKIIMLITGLKLYIRDYLTKIEKYDKSNWEMFMMMPLILCTLENIPQNAIAIKFSSYEFGELRCFLCALKTIGSGNCSDTTGSGNCSNTTGSGKCSIPELSFATDQELFINLLVSLIYSLWILSITPNSSYYLFSRYYYARGKCEKTGRVILGIMAGFRLHVTNYASIWFQLLPVGRFPEPFSKAILGMFITACVFLLIEVLMMFVTFCFSCELIKKTKDTDNKKYEESNDEKCKYCVGIVYMVILPVLCGFSSEFGSHFLDFLLFLSFLYLNLIGMILTSCKNE